MGVCLARWNGRLGSGIARYAPDSCIAATTTTHHTDFDWEHRTPTPEEIEVPTICYEGLRNINISCHNALATAAADFEI